MFSPRVLNVTDSYTTARSTYKQRLTMTNIESPKHMLDTVCGMDNKIYVYNSSWQSALHWKIKTRNR